MREVDNTTSLIISRSPRTTNFCFKKSSILINSKQHKGGEKLLLKLQDKKLKKTKVKITESHHFLCHTICLNLQNKKRICYIKT